MHKKSLLLMLTAISLMVMVVPLTADDSDADNTLNINGVSITYFDDKASVYAGSESSFRLTATNNNETVAMVYITSSNNSGGAFSCSVLGGQFDLAKADSKAVSVKLSADKLSKHGDYDMTLNITVVNTSTQESQSQSVTVTVTVSSSYSSDDVFNKILGIFPHLDAPFDQPQHTALITMSIWILIAFAVFLVFRSVIYLIFKKDKEAAKEIGKKTGITLVIAILFYGLSNAMMVYGALELVIAVLQNIASFIYIPLAAYIAWNIYTNTIKMIFHRLEEQDKISGADASLIPLFNLLGEILIVVIAASALLSTMGFDLVAIITGAGIAGMAISLGAQNTLTEFFSGINLMATRPFKRGDMVMIGGKDIYQVEKVGLMSSRFKNWISMEYIIIPNSTVVSSTIMNITGKTMAYRIFLYYTVAYDSDVEVTKKVLLDTAYNHPQVIVDGSYSKPDVRLNSFQDSAIEFRLAVYITDFRDHVTVTDELNEDVYRNLCKAGIEIPYNKLDVYIRSEEGDSQ